MYKQSILHNLMFQLPPATLILVFSTVLGLTDAHALPRQTTTVEHHELQHIVAWPPIPTEAPLSPFELLRRQEDNTICGYIGDLPATCSAGSHCVLDTEHNVMGCCPNGGACTAGVFTGCVDYNSGPQTENNPYVYTCAGSDVCYQNDFGGGVSQFGCGTASSLATTVQASLSGTDVMVITSSVDLTATPTTLSEPTTINPSTGTRSFSSSSSSSSTSSSSSSTSSSSSSSSSKSIATSSTQTTSSTNTSTPTEAPATTSSSFDRTGAIVGGTIAGVAILVAAIAIAIFCLRKHRNRRQGPGPAPSAAPTSEYMSPIRSHGAAFAPLPTWQEEEEPVTPQPHYNQPYGQQDHVLDTYTPYGPAQVHGAQVAHGQYGVPPSAPGYTLPAVAAGTPIADAHMRNPSNEIDDFSHGYAPAVGQTRLDEDQQPLTSSAYPHDYSHGYTATGGQFYAEENQQPPTDPTHHYSESDYGGGTHRSGDRPLWQQNIRGSRNLTWM